MNPSPRTRKTFVILTLLALLAPLALAALSAAPANAATPGAKYQNILKNKINVARSNRGRVPLANGAEAACHDRVAQRAAAYVTRRGTIAPRHLSSLNACGPDTVGYVSLRAKNPRIAFRTIMRQFAKKRVVLAPAGRNIGLGAKRNPDGTWSTIVAVAKAQVYVTPQPDPTDDTTPAPRVELGAEAAQMRTDIYKHTNIARANNGGLPALSTYACLENSAQQWAKKLADRDTGLEHQNLTLVFDSCPGFRTLGENVGYQWNSNGAEMVGLWMNSPGHKANILKPEYNRIGVGVAKGASGRWYGVQVFGYMN